MSLRFRVFFSGACATLAVMLCLLCARHAREEAGRARDEALARYGGETVSLVVAGDGLEAGDVVSSADVSMRDWLSDLAPRDALTSMDDAVGRSVTVPVAAGAPLTALNFRDEEPMAEIPSGHVAVSVPVTDKLGLSGGVDVGSRVMGYRADDDVSVLLSSDVTVLAVPASDGQSMRSGTLTIALPPGDVSAVLSASSSGDLRLVQPADDVDGVGSDDVAAPDEVPVEETQDEGAGAGDEVGESEEGWS